ncbi:MAG: ABC transporter ATP-binding protein [Gemmatimonadetes bacterium]|nr:ABC transporter ATP-binding protein [Gemmatimonadota bacterium]
MRDYLRVLRVLLPHKGRLLALLVCIVFASALSSVGITMVSPLLKILWEEPVEAPVPQESVPSADSLDPADALGLSGWKDRLKEGVRSWLDDNLYVGTKSEQLLRVCVWVFLLFLVKNLFGFLQEILRVDLEHRAIYRIREDLYRAIQALPLSFFSGERTGYLMSRVIVDVDMMRGAIVGGLTVFASNALMVILALTVAIIVSGTLSLATLLVVPPNAILAAVISRKLRKGSHRVQEEMGEVASVLQETISGIRVVKAFGMESAERSRFSGRNLRYYKAYVKLKIVEAMGSPVSEILGILTAVVILGIGGTLVIRGQLSPDMLVMFLVLMLWVIAPIKQLIKVNGTIQQSLAAAGRVFQILDAPREERSGGRTDLTPCVEGIRFENVSFAYREGQPVLKDLDLDVRSGEVIAVVGPSGAGKSTLVDLVPRFLRPTQGRVLLDGVDLAEADLSTLRSLVGMVTQEVILFHDTVRANLRYGKPDATGEELVEAARAANALEFIERLPQGFDTLIGERGTQLSGGQRQRLAIARAILRDPPILIFDEATSALDTESEQQIQQAVERLVRGRTTFVIAHRLSTVTRADRILVLEDGRLVESGSHAQLMDLEGSYRRLYELQFQTDGPGAAS